MPVSSLENLRKGLIRKARESVRQELSGKEVHVVKAVGLLEDLDRIFNLLSEHCIEWYSVYFPELKESISDNEVLLKLIAELGSRENFEEEDTIAIVGDKETASEISKTSETSMGAELSEKDLMQISILAVNALKVKEERKNLEGYVEELMLETAPNLSQIAGSLLGAKLIAKANGLRALALMHSSAVQLLGAEKALFRHLKSHKRALPPKFGFIFQHSLVQQAKPAHKGAMARSLAGKISIAARRDFFSKGKERIDSELQSGLQERFGQLQKLPEKQKKKIQGSFSRENPMLPKKFTPKPFGGNSRNSRPDFRKFGDRKPFRKFRK